MAINHTGINQVICAKEYRLNSRGIVLPDDS